MSNICSFCGKIFDGPSVKGLTGCVCPDCLKNMHDVYTEYSKATANIDRADLSLSEIPKPTDIKAYLDEYIIGQDYAKMVVATAVYNHYKRINQDDDDVEIEKSNIILQAPSGVGKTMIAKTVAKMLNVPFAIADCTSLTQAGYVGDDVETVLTKLLQNADYDVERAERGIVFLDELDKLGRKSGNPSITRDVGGEGVQQALLKLIEGNDVLVPPNGGRKHPDAKMIKVNTSNILFIGSGAFEGIERQIAQRMNKKTIGFNSAMTSTDIPDSELRHYVTSNDLRAFGLIPELLGRMPVIAYLDELDKESLIKILTEPKNAIMKQYTKLFAIDNVKLTVEPDVYEYIVDKAMERNLGARGLRAIVESIMLETMYRTPAEHPDEFVLTLSYAKEQLRKVKMEEEETVDAA